jgi:N-methylhydantoinase A
MADWRLAVDIGGTFTDTVLLDADSGRVAVHKELTTPANPLEGVQAAIGSVLGRAGVSATDVTAPIVHATTLVTNALVQRRAGRAALVVTQGFADTLLIRDEHRYDMYDLQIEFPDPPIPRQRVLELEERVNARGEVLTAPATEALDRIVEGLAAQDVEAVGVCFVNSYMNGANERAAGEYLAAALGVPVCLSAEVAPQIREYPRMMTTACNAAAMPVLGGYLDDLERWLAAEGFGGAVLMMLSNGGVVSAAEAARVPIRLVESGPAAGALAGTWYSQRLDEDRLLCFDMGGTTAKACLIEDFEPALTSSFEIARVWRFKKGSGYPVLVPSVDLVEIGAGGGSLARVDNLGLLRVGPVSSGADPGPASYGRGGTEPAVTDADLLVGYLSAEAFLGGEMPLDVDAARTAAEPLAERLDMDLENLASGIVEVVDQNMAASARMHAVERGVDLRGVTLLAFGGAGPVHACRVAELVESSRVVFPVHAGVLSAFGTLVTPVRIDLARSLLRPLAELRSDDTEQLLESMRSEGRRVLGGAGVPAEVVRFRYGIDVRYRGQGNEITVWLGEGPEWPTDDAETLAAFEAEYKRVYGLTIDDVPAEVVTWRLSASAPVTGVAPDLGAPAGGEATPIARRTVRFGRDSEPDEVAVYERAQLPAGMRLAGPMIISEAETTVVIRPGWTVEVNTDGSLLAQREEAA